jgi:alkylated DNA repair dioxygenase AlkB
MLPYEGEVIYKGSVFNRKQTTSYYQNLLHHIPWQNDEAIIFGKHHITKRKVAWYGDKVYSYTYSGVTKQAHLWTPELLQLKQKVEEISSTTYNSCLLNLYHDGAEGMGWHSDAEKTLLENGTIASITFGAERKFSFKHKVTKQRVDILLENGSLLLMKGTTQKNWLHRLPPTKKVFSPRINLTFRTVII